MVGTVALAGQLASAEPHGQACSGWSTPGVPWPLHHQCQQGRGRAGKVSSPPSHPRCAQAQGREEALGAGRQAAGTQLYLPSRPNLLEEPPPPSSPKRQRATAVLYMTPWVGGQVPPEPRPGRGVAHGAGSSHLPVYCQGSAVWPWTAPVCRMEGRWPHPRQPVGDVPGARPLAAS